MQVGSVRIEVIRFGLLIVLTVSLLSVAFRVDSHSSSHSSRPPGAGPHVTATPSSPAHVLPTATTRPSPSPARPRASGPAASGPGASSPGSRASGGTGTGTGTTAQLPATGWQGAVRLSALSLVLIGAGAVSVRAAGPRRVSAATRPARRGRRSR